MTLRTGLVEAMAKDLLPYEVRVAMRFNWGESGIDVIEKGVAVAALDRALGFLIDNAIQWEKEVEHFSAGVQVYGVTARSLIAVLSDSRDTGEKSDA